MKFMTRVIVTFFVLVTVADAQTTAITGATVHTVGPNGTIENATIVIENGRIAAVGANVTVPANADRIDAAGKVVTPGLFTPSGQIGLTEVSSVSSSNDSAQSGDDFTAGFDVIEAYNPRSMLIAVNRADGITRATIVPRAAGGGPGGGGSSSHVLSGLGSVVQLGDESDHVVKRGAVVVANLGQSGSNLAGGSRAAAVMVLRAALDDARDYRQNKAAYDRGDWREYSVSTTDLDALQSVLDGSTPVLFNVNRASDIEGVLALAAEYNIRAIIAGGGEAWMVADAIAAAGVPVILDLVNNLPGNFDRINARMDAATILADAGATVAFDAGALSPGGQTYNARNLTQAAGIAVANGVSWDAALEAITLTPARIYGMDDSVGSIEAGKEADIVIWPGDPLELTNLPEQVYVRGTAVSLENRHTLLRDRYLQSADTPPAYRN